MSVMSSFYNNLFKIGIIFQSLFLLAVRLLWGYAFFLAGLGKLEDPGTTSQYFASLNIVFPTFTAYVVGLIEMCGGLLLMCGLLTRLAAIPLTFVMIGAYLTAHLSSVKAIFSDPEMFFAQTPFMFLLASIFLFAFGPGWLSLDALIYWIYCKVTKNKWEGV
jgi:putative oxidoreductase